MDFESYLISKRIDSARFNESEPDVWRAWKQDFEQMHPNSFTLQKLNLINPIRRKYQLTIVEPPKVATPVAKTPSAPLAKTVMKVSRPGIVTPKANTLDTAERLNTEKPGSSDASNAATGSVESIPADTIVSAPTPEASSSTETIPGEERPIDKPKPAGDDTPVSEKPKPAARPVIPRPVIKPKPKTN